MLAAWFAGGEVCWRRGLLAAWFYRRGFIDVGFIDVGFIDVGFIDVGFIDVGFMLGL